MNATKSREVVSVRPTKDGQWETVETTVVEDRKWQKEWAEWYRLVGESLSKEHPDWWKEE